MLLGHEQSMARRRGQLWKQWFTVGGGRLLVSGERQRGAAGMREALSPTHHRGRQAMLRCSGELPGPSHVHCCKAWNQAAAHLSLLLRVRAAESICYA